MPAKFVDNQVESEDESELNIDLDMLQVPISRFTFVNYPSSPIRPFMPIL